MWYKKWVTISLFPLLFCAYSSKAEEKAWFEKITVAPILNVISGYQKDDSKTVAVPAGTSALRGGLGELRGNPGPSRDTFNFYLDSLEVDLWTAPEAMVQLRADFDYSRDNAGAGGAGAVSTEQAYMMVKTKLGRGLQLTLGRVNDPTGIEGEDRFDNPTIFFSWANRMTANNITGLFLKYPFSDHLDGQLFIINNFRDSIANDSVIPSFGGTVNGHWGTEEKPQELGFGFNAGPEQPNDNRHWTFLGDVFVRLHLTRRLRMDVEGLYAQTNTTVAGAKNNKAFAGYILGDLQLGNNWGFYGRYGFARDVNAVGVFTGAKQDIHQNTLGFRYQLTENARMRLEYETDWHLPAGDATSLSHAVAMEVNYLF